MSGLMSISKAKEAERARLQQEMEEFLAKGGNVTKAPTHSVGYGYQNYRQSKEAAKKPSKPSTFNPKAECQKLIQAENERRTKRNKTKESYKQQDMLNEKAFLKGQVAPPWERN